MPVQTEVGWFACCQMLSSNLWSKICLPFYVQGSNSRVDVALETYAIYTRPISFMGEISLGDYILTRPNSYSCHNCSSKIRTWSFSCVMQDRHYTGRHFSQVFLYIENYVPLYLLRIFVFTCIQTTWCKLSLGLSNLTSCVRTHSRLSYYNLAWPFPD